MILDEHAYRHLVYHVGQTVESIFLNCTENQLICQPLESRQDLLRMNEQLNDCYAPGGTMFKFIDVSRKPDCLDWELKVL